MNAITIKSPASNRFFDIKNSDNELVLINTKKEEISIPYSDLKKIYIKKNKINVSLQKSLVAVLLLLFSITSYMSHPEIGFVPMMLGIPLLSKTHRFKWYHLQLELQDGTVFSKRFYCDKKHFYINAVNRIKSDLFYYQVNGSNPPKREYSLTDFEIPSWRFA